MRATTVSGYRTHGELDSDEAVGLISGRLAEAAERPGCRQKSGGNDATTYLFPSRVERLRLNLQGGLPSRMNVKMSSGRT